jgi:DNA primase
VISKQTIARILEDAHIEEVIGEFVKLKKSGQNYKGLSPFTTERNPSFYVSPSKGIYKCFSSGKGGNVVNFLMEHEHFTYPEALMFLAKKYGIAVEEDAISTEDIQAENEKETLYQVTAFAMKYFSECLLETEAGKAIGLEYLKNRDLRLDTVKKFQLGYSPETWDAFTKHAIAEGYKLEYLEKSGLTITKEGRSYDRFRGRVIFPVHNISGRILGFGGRTLLKDDNVPKYVNSPESDIYNKSQILFGLYFAKNAIIKIDNCYLVEGYTDVISLHQAGIENVVASSGTSLTEEQIRLIKRYTPNITILYDGDPAGIKASFRGIDMVLEQGMNVRIVLFPDGEDPDSYARKHRRAELEELITAKAQDFIRFKTSLLLKEAAGDPIKKAGLIKEIVGSITLIPDPIYRSVYIKECSTLMEIQEQTLMNALNKLLYQRNRKQEEQDAVKQEVEFIETPSVRQVETDQSSSEFQEKDLIRLLVNYPDDNIMIREDQGDGHFLQQAISVSRYIIEEIHKDELSFSNPAYQRVFDKYDQTLQSGGELSEIGNFEDEQEQAIIATIRDLQINRYELSVNWLSNKIQVVTEKDILFQAVETTLYAFKAKTLERMTNEILKEMKESANEEDIMILQAKYKGLKEISRKIHGKLGRIITK